MNAYSWPEYWYKDLVQIKDLEKLNKMLVLLQGNIDKVKVFQIQSKPDNQFLQLQFTIKDEALIEKLRQYPEYIYLGPNVGIQFMTENLLENVKKLGALSYVSNIKVDKPTWVEKIKIAALTL